MTNTACICAICLDEINENKNSCILDCGHKLHCSCLCTNVLFKRYSCPLCKKNIIEDDIVQKQITIHENNNTYYNNIYNINYDIQLQNKRLRITQYKNYPILKQIYKEVLEFKKMLKITKQILIQLDKTLIAQNADIFSQIKENKKHYKQYYQKYLRRERKFIQKANQILNINEDFSIF